MNAYAGSITVEDASGARFQLHKFRTTRLFLPGNRFELETGEEAQPVDENTFRLVATGETLMRV
jgi:hypothetical protein